ncbi:MAG: ral nucleoside transport system permease protein nupA, partial [Chloroflexota bacterium]|nr:ral nucleoside transport system permease protein nupA [Chloroflexota bacterium]
TATTPSIVLSRRDPRVLWGGVTVVIVVLALLALALDVPYLGSFVDWLINRVPPLSYLIVQYAVPIAFGALCGVMCERSGVVNIGIEGMILTSAFVAFLTGAYLHPIVGAPLAAIFGIVAAIVASMLLSTLHAWLSISIKADQIISGTVINILALGGTAFFNQLLVSTSGLSGTNTLPRFDVPNEIAAIPLVGPIVNALLNQGPIAMSLILFVLGLQVLLFRSRWGLRTRAVGEHPKAADTVGIDVIRTRYRSVILGGVFAGLAGAYLTLEQFNSFQDNMTGGVGFIGLAAMIFGRWTPLGAYGAALLFGTVQSMQLAVRISPPKGDLGAIISTIPPQIFGMLPYIFTIIVLAGVVGRAIPPAADGIPYDKEARG